MAIVTSENDTVGLIERALDQTATIIAAIGAGQPTLATPCPDWDVRALVRHVIGQDMRNFIVAARGETVDWQAPAGGFGEDRAGACRGRAGQLLGGRQARDVDGPVASARAGRRSVGGRADPRGDEPAMHGWDLLEATT